MRERDAAARRAADAMVRTLGGCAVSVEFPLPPVAADDDEQLGLSSPEFQARSLHPVAVRRETNRTELLVAAEVLEEFLGVDTYGAVDAAARTAYAVVFAGERYRVMGTDYVMAQGEPCVYHLQLQRVGTEVV